MDTTFLSSIKIELVNIYDDDDELLEIKIALGKTKSHDGIACFTLFLRF